MSDPRHSTRFAWGIPGDTPDRQQTIAELEDRDRTNDPAAARVIAAHVADPVARRLIYAALDIQVGA
jgi:hypothetical protein